MATGNGITVHTRYLAATDPSLPALAIQVTQLVNSYMLWVGTTELLPADVDNAATHGSLSKDWACAMPPKTSGTPAPATSLFRSSSSDVALSMAQRLAKRFKKQLFLSVDVPSSFLSVGQGREILLEAERGIVETLLDMETSSQ